MRALASRPQVVSDAKIEVTGQTAAFAADVLAGLMATPKRLSPKYFYDSIGSALFEQITELPEYYPTRTEIGILSEHAGDIAALIPNGAALIEFGSGSSTKTRKVLSTATSLAAYVPVDISAQFLQQQAVELRREFPKLNVLPVAADFTKPFDLPDAVRTMPRVGFFPGSTIGNFEPRQVVAFLSDWAKLLGPGGEMLIGADLKKDPKILNAAYNDKAGINAAFNLNLLTRINRELGGDFDLDRFAHVAFYSEADGRVELYLKSLAEQTVMAAGQRFRFGAGELIHTENSYKYAIADFRALAARAGFQAVETWTDPAQLFSVHYLRRRD
jgi:dimethylhistidine N-methyltransferase